MKRLLLLILAALPLSSACVAQPDRTCLAAATVADDDFPAHLTELSRPELCISERRFEENGTAWHIVVIRNTARPGPLWAVPHDDEDAAFASAVYAVAAYGGVVVAVESGGGRMHAGKDPNRLFATTPAEAEICPGADAPAPLYVAAYLDEWDRDYPVVGLHTNADGYLGGGGLGTISIRRQDPKMIAFPSASATGRLADQDTQVMLFSQRLPTENTIGMPAVNWFTSRGLARHSCGLSARDRHQQRMHDGRLPHPQPPGLSTHHRDRAW
jgi:hypothetical protein